MATALRWSLSAAKCASLVGTDMIGATAIPASFVPLLGSAASQQSSTVRLSSRMAMAVLTLNRFNRLCESRPDSIILYAFDLLHLDGKDLRQEALTERRYELKRLVGSEADSRDSIQRGVRW